jgi:bifunctional non-homologous end joining protein LigD
VRHLSLLERKRLLVGVLPKIETRLLHLDHIVERGGALFDLARERDLEGIVAKWAHGTYQSDGTGTSWLKIKNENYTQARGRREMFEARRDRRQERRGQRAAELRLA